MKGIDILNTALVVGGVIIIGWRPDGAVVDVIAAGIGAALIGYAGMRYQAGRGD